MNEIIKIVDVTEFGKRLKMIRRSLGMTQTEVGHEIQSNQLFISKIERGEKVLSPIIINLLAFYSQSIAIDRLFDKTFDIKNELIFNKKLNMQSMIKEKLKILKDEIADNMQKNKIIIDEQMNDAIELL